MRAHRHGPVRKDARLSDSKITLRFQGKDIACRRGTSVAVALWEGGVRVLSHSPKYGRERGVTCARGQCTACLMRIDGVPNVRACETIVRDGMTVEKQDTGAVYGPLLQKTLATADSLFPVGFYYKWFTRPAALSRFFLKQLRPMTGVGRIPAAQAGLRALPAAAAPDEAAPAPAADWGHGVPVIVGGGPSGLEAALAADPGSVVLDDHDEPGGQRAAALDRAAAFLGDRLQRLPVLAAAVERLNDLRARFAAREDLRFVGSAKVVAGYRPGGLVIRRGSELATIDFPQLTWAAGALDVHGLFPGNDVPGLIGPRALYRLVCRDGLDLAGKPVLLVGGGLDLWLSAALAAAAGARPALVLTEHGEQTEVSAAVDAGWQLTTGMQLASLRATNGSRVSATLVPRESTPGPLGSHLELEADWVVVCQPGKPSFDVAYQVGVDYELAPAAGGFVPSGRTAAGFAGTLPDGAPVAIVGEAAGLTDQIPTPDTEGAAS